MLFVYHKFTQKSHVLTYKILTG